MKLSMKALATTSALLWGGCILFVGIVRFAFPTYGTEFLRVVSSIYPGYDAAPTATSTLIGTLWGLVDGAVGGFLFALIYNRALMKDNG